MIHVYMYVCYGIVECDNLRQLLWLLKRYILLSLSSYPFHNVYHNEHFDNGLGRLHLSCV